MKISKHFLYISVIVFFIFIISLMTVRTVNYSPQVATVINTINTGLIAQYKLDDGSRSKIADSSGSGNSATLSGPISWTTGKINGALSFNGTNNYATTSKVLPVFTEFTASAWVKVNDLSLNRGIFTSGGLNNKGFRFRINKDGSVFVLMAGKNSYDILSTPSGIIKNGIFNHIAVVGKSGQNISIYVNGVLKASKTTTQIIDTPTSFAYIGSSWNASLELMNGVMDEVRIYKRVLTASEITDLYKYAGITSSSSLSSFSSISSSKSSSSSSVAKSSSSSSSSASKSSSSVSTQSLPVAITNLATNITQTSAALNASVNGNGLPVSAYFKYGLSSTTLTSKTSNQTISNLGNIAISSTISSLSPATVYYYRVVAVSSAGTAYGSIKNFTTLSSTTSTDSSWKNYYLPAWRDTPENALRYATQMGYDYIPAKQWPPSYYTSNSGYAGKKFYVVDPQNMPGAYAGIPTVSTLGEIGGGRVLDTSKTYTQAQKDWYNSHMVWKSNAAWPDNLANSVYPDLKKPYRYSIMWDYQQQAVIDELIQKIMNMFHAYENKSLPFTLGGYGMDVPALYTEFRYLNANGSQVRSSLAHWTGTDSGVPHSGIIQNYKTYTEGVFAFHKQLSSRMKKEFPNSKWFLDPSRIYSATSPDEWIKLIKDRSDRDALTPDMLTEEGATVDFVNEPLNFNSGVNLTKDRVGDEQRSDGTEITNRLIAAMAGINGAWYNWFGQFGITGTKMPNFQSITDVYPRLKLIRVVPNWDNLLNVPLSQRSWDGAVYKSSNSYISSDIIYTHHWKNPSKLFAVFNTANGKIKLRPNETVVSIKDVNGYFEENIDVKNLFKITPKTDGDEIVFANPTSIIIANDVSNNQVKGNGYILTISQG